MKKILNNWHTWIYRFFTWSRVKVWINNKFVASSSIMLITVPIMTKLFAETEKIVYIDTLNLKLSLELPFNYILLFVAALSLFIADMTYQVACPEIVKKYTDYDSFNKSGHSVFYLRDYLLPFSPYDRELKKNRLRGRDASINQKQFRPFDKYYRDKGSKKFNINNNCLGEVYNYHFLNEGDSLKAMKTGDRVKYQIDEAHFWDVYEFVNTNSPFSRFLCYLFTIIGFLCVSIVFIQNVFFVFNFYFTN